MRNFKRLPGSYPAFCGSLMLAAIAGCGGGGGGGTPANGPACGSGEYCGAIPLSVDACGDTEYWPLSAQSNLRPLTVHYSRLADESTAMEMLAILEHAWDVQVDRLGFSAPLDDGGNCGPDGRYDVFVWRGVDGAFVDSVTDNPQTPHDDYTTCMVIDPSGDYGGALLDTTLAHEFNHAVQASDDWWESALIFEMGATFVEALVYPEQDDYFYVIEDFQARPQWSLFHDDAYRTWYMYGAALYLHFLYERYFPEDPAFIARVWRQARSEPPAVRPDYIDALRAVLLTERGVDLDDAIVEFMQWRWFVAEWDDGAHFERGGDWPYAVAHVELDAAEPAIAVDVGAMLYGAGYLRLENESTADRVFSVTLESDDADVVWRVTTATGGDVAGSIAVPAGSSLVLVAVALPAEPIPAQTLDAGTRTMAVHLTEI